MQAIAERGFSLIELMIVAAVLATLAAVALPLYRGYAETARDAALVKQMSAIAVFQEDTRLRTGSYGAGRYDPKGAKTLTDAIGWAPSGDDGTTYEVTLAGSGWQVVATDSSGRRLCRRYPAATACSP